MTILHRPVCVLLSGVLASAPALAQQAPAVWQASATDHSQSDDASAKPDARDELAAEKAFLAGAKAMQRDDAHEAYDSFVHAAELEPGNTQYRAAREIAREHFVTYLVQAADKARLTGHPELSTAKLAEALQLDPKNPVIAQHVDDLATEQLRSMQVSEGDGTELSPPVQLQPAAGKRSFNLKGGGDDIIRQVLSAYQITPVFEAPMPFQIMRYEVDDVDFTQAADAVKTLTNTFFVPLDPRRVLVAKDSRENRQKYERMLVESVYLPGLSTTELTDMSNMARNLFDAPVVAAQPQRNILTIRAPESRMRALNATLADLLDGRAQLQLEVQLYEVDKTKTTNLGVQLPSQSVAFNLQSELNQLLQNNQAAINQIISSGLAAPGDYAAILAILIATGQISSSVLSQGFLTFGGGITEWGYTLGTLTGNAALNSSDVRTIDEAKLRLQDQETGTFMAGTHYPILVSTYTSGAASTVNIPGVSSAGVSSALSGLSTTLTGLGTSQVTIPQIQYQDLGLSLKVTPRIQHNDAITLKLELKLDALGGSSLNNIPILNNREYSAVLTLRDGDSALVVSGLSRSESNAITGVPGLNELPGFESGTNQDRDYDVSNLIVLVTPHIVRKTHIQVAGREILIPKHD